MAAQLTSCVNHLIPPLHAMPWARERSRLDGELLIERWDQQEQGHVNRTLATQRPSTECCGAATRDARDSV
ncbi:MAG: hypothetical protein AUH78_21885 [Gemmatimonadetes bacterium 13_1_40CM_4_69_8]|nr:MAG: hypothetical protein AUH78_21885 [Gemmatimonadetes bacterium 13_1_40CM_4_69_8]